MNLDLHPRDDDQARALIEAMSAAGAHLTTETDGIQLSWHRWGQGPALVLLHGGSGSWTHWIRNIPALSARYTVLAADLPGLGDSTLPPPGYTAPSLAQLVAGGLGQLLPGNEPFDLVGFSFGGIVGGHVAVREAARIRSLTIVGSPVFGMGPTGPANEISAVDPALELADAAPLHRRNLELLMMADAAHAADPLALRVHHDNLRRARLRSRKIARTDTLLQALRETRCPLAGIWGEADVTIHPSLDALRGSFLDQDARASFDVIDGAGHWVAFEDHARFDTVLLERLAGASRGG